MKDERLGRPSTTPPSAKVEQPLGDSGSAPEADGEDGRLDVTKPLSLRQLATAIYATSKDSDKEGSSSGEKVSMQDTGTPHPPKEEVEKSAAFGRPGNASTKDSAATAFEEPPLADGDDRTRFFQRPGFTKLVDHAENSSSQKKPPFSTIPGESASHRHSAPSLGGAQRIEEKVAASSDNAIPVQHLAALSEKTTGNLSTTTTSSLLVPLVITLNLCTAALFIVVGAFLIHTLGGFPHLLSLFRK